MHHIDYKAIHLETFTKQKHCDVFFSCENSEGEWESIGAHKFLLMSVSEVFEKIFYGKSEEYGDVQEENVIEIKDISMETIELFLRYIYGGVITFNCAVTTAEFYSACHKYKCKDGLVFGEKCMTKDLSPHNVIIYFETAVLYNLPELKAACWKVFLKETKDVLCCVKIFSARPEIFELLFQQEDIKIDSENDLIVALERYVGHHKDYDPEIAGKVRPAVNCIRFLTLTAKEIAETSLLTPEEMRDVIKCLPPAHDLSKMPQSLSRNAKKRKNAKQDIVDLKKTLNEVFLSHFCVWCSQNNHKHCKHAVWKCPLFNLDRKIELKNIFSKYNHTFLTEYSDADVQTVYNIYKLNELI